MKPKTNQSVAGKNTTSANKQTTAYWKVRNAWVKPSKRPTDQMTFGKAVTELQRIIDRPATPHLGKLAQALLDDIVYNSEDVSVSSHVPKITGKPKK